MMRLTSSLTCREDFEDHDQVGHIVSRCHGAFLVRADLTDLFDLLWRERDKASTRSVAP